MRERPEDRVIENRGLLMKAVAEQFADGLPSTVDKIWLADSSAIPVYYFWNLTPDSRHNLPIMNAREEFEDPVP